MVVQKFLHGNQQGPYHLFNAARIPAVFMLGCLLLAFLRGRRDGILLPLGIFALAVRSKEQAGWTPGFRLGSSNSSDTWPEKPTENLIKIPFHADGSQAKFPNAASPHKPCLGTLPRFLVAQRRAWANGGGPSHQSVALIRPFLLECAIKRQ